VARRWKEPPCLASRTARLMPAGDEIDFAAP
jgi:hypothetical protein